MPNYKLASPCLFFFFLLSVLLTACISKKEQTIENGALDKNWVLQSSDKVNVEGEEISSADFNSKDWHQALVPGTVLGSLVADSTFTDIFVSDHLEHIPSDLFDVPWWYRTTFEINKDTGQVVQLRFNGINYRASIWLNGKKVADADSIEGGFRRFTFDISKEVQSGENVLAVKVIRPYPGELTVGFVDWNPEPPDHNLGIWRTVELLVSGPVSIDQPFVQTKVDTATLDHARLTIRALLKNHSDEEITGQLKGIIGKNEISVSQEVQLQPGEEKEVVFTPEEYEDLSMDHPKLWWVHTWGEPYLYDLHLRFEEGNQISDTLHTRFGIREVTDYFTEQGFRGFKLNGKKILIKGGGWVDKMLLDGSKAYERAGVEYAKHMNLNAMRMEGFWGQDEHLYDLFDENGILLMAGFSCHWEWEEYLGTPDDEYSAILTPKQNDIAAQSWRDQISWLRNHASIFAWLYGSDKSPRPELEERYIATMKKYDTTRVAISSAADYTPGIDDATEHISQLSGPSAMKMRGPYDYVPPAYWYVDTANGGAFGFNTETSPGPEMVVKESLKKMIPADSLWPINKAWLYHAARNNFYNFTYYNNAIDQRLGPPADLDDYLRKAQFINYEGMRAMFEAFEANRPKATGIIQWMYNASWPKLWWQLYDYYLMPTAAFYATKKANEPIHISYNYGDQSVELINNTPQDQSGLKTRIQVLNFDMQQVLEKEILTDHLKDRETKKLFTLPDGLEVSKTWFLALKTYDEEDRMVSDNFYALSTQKDELDEAATTWYTTPQKRFADLTMLEGLPPVELESEISFKEKNQETYAAVRLKNPSDQLAFMVHLDLKKGEKGSSVVPVFWPDNYFSLLPGEEKTVEVHCETKNLEGKQPIIKIEGWNIRNS